MADEKREFTRNFDSCFVGIPYKQEYRAFCVRGTNPDGTVAGILISKACKETSTRMHYEEMVRDMRPIIPAGGYFNVNLTPPTPGAKQFVTALFVEVSPERQFRKGLAGDVRYVRHGVTPSPHFNMMWNTCAVHAAGSYPFENKVLAHHLATGRGRELVSLRQAADMVESAEHFLVAFSKFFACSLRPNFAYPVIVSGNDLVGVYAHGTIWATDKIFHLADFFDKRWAVPMKHIKTYNKRTYAR